MGNLLLCAALMMGQSVSLPNEIKGVPGAWVIVAPKVDGGTPKWRIDPGLQEVDLGILLGEFSGKLKGKVFTSVVEGKYKIECWNAKGDVASDIAICYVIIGNPTPPKPPDPSVKAPIDSPGYKVLMIFEKQEQNLLKPGHFQAIYGGAIRDKLESLCVSEGDGTKAYRIWDKDVDTKYQAKYWQDAFNRNKVLPLPRLIISNGVTGIETTIPEKLEDTFALMEKYK